MVDYAYPQTMHHDFELYAQEQEQQQLQYMSSTQPFLPSSTYSMEPSFSASYEHMMPLVEAPRPQYSYDQLAQEHKFAQQYNYHTPSGSPNSTFNSFQDQPPILSASSESGASASSSALGSPSITPQFEMESWNPMAMMTSGLEYPAIIANEKTFIGESVLHSAIATPSISSPTPSVSSTVFKAPTTPASALRRSSIVSDTYDPFTSSHPLNSPSSSLSRSSDYVSSPQESCSFLPELSYFILSKMLTWNRRPKHDPALCVCSPEPLP